jgi:hypothetical protein
MSETIQSNNTTSSELKLPDTVVVKSQVRKVATRTVRSQHPTRHRFKQYVLGDPHKRLTRGRSVNITSQELVKNLDLFIDEESVGKLSIHALDGSRINLTLLRENIFALTRQAPSTPLYRGRLDSIEFDPPAGIPLPKYVDGTFPGDPAAQRAMERMVVEKKEEAIRHGADEIEESNTLEKALDLEDIEEVEADVPTELKKESVEDSSLAEAVTELPPPPSLSSISVSPIIPPTAPVVSLNVTPHRQVDPAQARFNSHKDKQRKK